MHFKLLCLFIHSLFRFFLFYWMLMQCANSSHSTLKLPSFKPLSVFIYTTHEVALTWTVTTVPYQNDFLNFFGWTPVKHSSGVVSLHTSIHALNLLISRNKQRVVPVKSAKKTHKLDLIRHQHLILQMQVGKNTTIGIYPSGLIVTFVKGQTFSASAQKSIDNK